ncbi:MAG TPA: hypothetical protein VNL97_07515 [Solirubrobacterales bacterium]|nr:hypothetical protein [Solirubrobacterales bacterium]
MCRAVLREHKGKATNKPIYVGDEAFITLLSVPADAEVTCSVFLPNGYREPLDVRRRSTDLFADHVAVFTVDTEGKHRYQFTVNGKRCGGGFMVRPANQSKKRR